MEDLLGLYDELSSFLTGINLYNSKGISDSHNFCSCIMDTVGGDELVCVGSIVSYSTQLRMVLERSCSSREIPLLPSCIPQSYLHVEIHMYRTPQSMYILRKETQQPHWQRKIFTPASWLSKVYISFSPFGSEKNPSLV